MSFGRHFRRSIAGGGPVDPHAVDSKYTPPGGWNVASRAGATSAAWRRPSCACRRTRRSSAGSRTRRATWSPPATSMYSCVMPSFFISLGPRADPLDLHQLVVVALHEDHRDVLDLLQVGRRRGRWPARSGPGRPTGRGYLTRQVPRAAAAHRVADQVDAVGVDVVLLADDLQDVHHVLLAQLGEVLRVGVRALHEHLAAVPAAVL